MCRNYCSWPTSFFGSNKDPFDVYPKRLGLTLLSKKERPEFPGRVFGRIVLLCPIRVPCALECVVGRFSMAKTRRIYRPHVRVLFLFPENVNHEILLFGTIPRGVG